MTDNDSLFSQFESTRIFETRLEAFNYPYLYKLNPFTEYAVQQLQSHLQSTQFGQMFAVLVVQNSLAEVGYLIGFSGAILKSKQDGIKFVPRVIDEAFSNDLSQRYGEKKDALLKQKEQLEHSTNLSQLKSDYAQQQISAEIEIKAQQAAIVQARKERKKQRTDAKNTNDLVLINSLNQQSIQQKKALQYLKKQWQDRLCTLKAKLDLIDFEINNLNKELDALYEDYKSAINANSICLNRIGDEKTVNDLFAGEPVEDAADEAIVKLLNYAFKSQLQPLSFGQFWWGPSPYQEVRQHGRTYPVSQTKCKPILAHMLSGINVADDPLLNRLNKIQQLDIVHQDHAFIVINKPTDLLSVAGINVENSVYSLARKHFPDATGPLIVHRLDMATSGLMVIALDKESHKHLQSQFINHTVKKRYVALLNGVLEAENGKVVLPLRPDLSDRPRQVVCDEYGRYAETDWQLVEHYQTTTRVYFYPKTGRSHQLRMHAAHQDGLNMPIVGDELYGYSAERLYLHADLLGFIHPKSGQYVEFFTNAVF